MTPLNMQDHSIWHHSSWHNSVNLKTTSPHGIILDIVDNIMALQDSSTSTPPRDRRLHYLQSLHEDITVLPALRRSAFERQIQPLQKTPGQTALPAFHQIVYANFRRNQDHSLNVRHASVLVFNASVSTKEQA
jgi:hypothetical protein